MDWKTKKPVRGDIIRTKVGPIYHYGIFVAEDQIVQFGYPPMGPFAKEEELVCLTDVPGFSLGLPLEVGVPTSEDNDTRLPVEECVDKALSQLDQGGYNLLHNNCEHFANWCYFGRRFSKQEEELRAWWRRRKVCAVYFSPLLDLALPSYPESRVKEIEGVKDKTLRREKITTWSLLFEAAKHSFNLDPNNIDFRKDEYGKWSCPDFFFSISHAHDLVMVGVSNGPIGVDLENKERFLTRWSDPKKLAGLEKALNSQREDPFELWLRKESYFKAYGQKNFNPSLEMEDKPYALGEYEGYGYCLYADYADAVSYHRLENGKIVPAQTEEKR